MDTPEKDYWISEGDNDEFEAIYAEILKEFGEKPETKKKEQKIQSAAKPAPRPVQPAPDKNTYADRQKAAPPVKKEKGIGALIVLVILELMGITGVAVWWIMHLL